MQPGYQLKSRSVAPLGYRDADELEEIANNIAVALMVSAITLTLALFLGGGMDFSQRNCAGAAGLERKLTF